MKKTMKMATALIFITLIAVMALTCSAKTGFRADMNAASVRNAATGNLTVGAAIEVIKTNTQNPSDVTAQTGETSAESDEAENELGYIPSEASEYEGYELGASGVAAIAALALLVGFIVFLSARKAVKDGIY